MTKAHSEHCKLTLPSPLPCCVAVPETGHCLLAHIATPQAWAEQGITREAPEKRRKPPSVASAEENDEDHILDEPFLVSAFSLPDPLTLSPHML